MSQTFINEVQHILDERIKPLIAEYWSSEVTVPIETKILPDTLDSFDVIIDTPRKNLKLFSQKQLQFIKEVLLFDESRNDFFNAIIFNIEKEIEFRSKGQIDLIIQSQLTRSETYCLVLDKYYNKKRSFFGRLFGKERLRDENLYSFEEMVQLLCPRVLKIPRRRPKVTERIRGYRDHGTLGSDTPDKEIVDTLSIMAKLENELKAKYTLQFLKGFL